MGCKGSKLDDQEAVALCRGRADLIAAAVRHRYALADAHGALADSFESMAVPLQHLLFLLASPQLTLPSARKGGRVGGGGLLSSSSPPAGHSSHIDMESSSASESTSPEESPSHRAPEQFFFSNKGFPPEQLQHPNYAYVPDNAFAYPAPASSLQFYYARSRPPPASVSVAQQAPESERVYYGSFDVAGGYSHPQYYAYGGQPAAAVPQRPVAVPQLPAAPPPPLRESSWDFLNVFDNYESYDGYYYDSATAAAATAYTPSRSSREVREEEGIPELEEDEEESVVVKEVASQYSTAGSGGRRRARSTVGRVNGISELYKPQNNVVRDDAGGNVRRRRPPAAYRHVAAREPEQPAQRVVGDAVGASSDVKTQLVRAAAAAKELAPLLEVGKPNHHPHHSVSHAPSRMMSAISAPHLGCKDVDMLDVVVSGEARMAGSWSLSLTLEKLYFWERKLYGEVKAEEKMRLLVAKNSKRLKLLDQRGAEAQKIDATRDLLRKLSTKIRIAVRVIAKVSRKINKVRDEELEPQVNTLIQGFAKMWQDKLHSYQTQFQVMSEVKNIGSAVPGENGRDLAMVLELELIKWIINFSSWVGAHRNFVKALNGWLALCLNYEPEEITHGVPPYSPGRIGAPLVFVICNKWSQATDRISEKDVVNAMQALVSSVRHLWEQQNLEQSEQMVAIRERDKWIKILERKTLEINKDADELNRKLALVPSRQNFQRPPTIQTYEAHCIEPSNVHINFRLVLQALENFAANSVQAFQEILRVAEQERLSRENVRVP